MSRAPKLSKRQREIVRLIDRGLDTNEIARELAISKWTVRDHIRGLCRQLDCSMVDLPRKARAAGAAF